MSVLAEKINKFNELSELYIQEGFLYAKEAGEFLQEVQQLKGKKEFPEWLKENCSISLSKAYSYMKLFNGKEIQVKAFIQEKEVSEN